MCNDEGDVQENIGLAFCFCVSRTASGKFEEDIIPAHEDFVWKTEFVMFRYLPTNPHTDVPGSPHRCRLSCSHVGAVLDLRAV